MGTSRGNEKKYTVLLIVVLIVVGVLFGWSYYSYQSAMTDDSSSDASTELISLRDKEKQDIVDRISNKISVPLDEVPIIATVDEATTLAASQPFFASVQNGDKLVLYNSRAIIYRAETDTIINTGNITRLDDGTNAIETIVSDSEGTMQEELNDQEEELPIPTTGEGISVEVRNGTTISGFAGKTRNELEDELYTVERVGNASRQNYEETVLVLLNEEVDVRGLEKKYTTVAIETLPTGEAASTADVVIILGSN